MAYTRVNGMRSTRFPLQGQAGLGCNCHAPSPVTAALRGLRGLGLGLDVESAAVGGSITASGLVGLAIGGALGYWFGGQKNSMRRNRRRHRRN